MAVPVVQLADVLYICEQLVGRINPVRWSTANFTAYAKAADGEIAATIALAPGHPLQAQMYVDSDPIAHKGELPISLAGYANVRVDTEQAFNLKAHEIGRLLTHETVAANELTMPYYDFHGKRLYHTGTSAIVGYVPVTLQDESSLRSPAAYLYAVVIGTLRLAGIQDWSELGFSSDLAQEYRSRLQLIQGDANLGIIREIPALQPKVEQ
jgi:hypothetical protein